MKIQLEIFRKEKDKNLIENAEWIDFFFLIYFLQNTTQKIAEAFYR